MANGFLQDIGLESLTLPEAPSVDISQVPQQYQAQYGTTAEAERIQRERQAQLAPGQVQTQREALQAGLAQRMGQNVLGVAGAEAAQPFEEKAAEFLTEQDYKKAYEGELKKGIRTQQLRQELAAKGMRDVGRIHQRQMQDFSREYAQLRGRLANKMVDERRQLQRQLEDDFNQSMDAVQASLLGRERRRRVGGIIGGVAGAGLGFAFGGGPMGAVKWGQAGMGLGRGVSGMGANRYYQELQRGITL